MSYNSGFRNLGRTKTGYEWRTREEVVENCPDLTKLRPNEKPTVRCLWQGGQPSVINAVLVYVPGNTEHDCILVNTDGYDDWGHELVEREGWWEGRKFFFIALET